MRIDLTYVIYIYIYHVLQCLMGIISGFQSYRNSMGFPSHFSSARCVFFDVRRPRKRQSRQASRAPRRRCDAAYSMVNGYVMVIDFWLFMFIYLVVIQWLMVIQWLWKVVI